MTRTNRWLEAWGSLITHRWLVAIAAFLAPLISIASPKIFTLYLSILATSVAVPLWLACFEPDSRYFGRNLPLQRTIKNWIFAVAILGGLFGIGNYFAFDDADALSRTLKVFATLLAVLIFAAGLPVLEDEKHKILLDALLVGVICAACLLIIIGIMHPYRIEFWREFRLFRLPLPGVYNLSHIVLVFLAWISCWHTVQTQRTATGLATLGLVACATFLSSSESAKVGLIVLALLFVAIALIGRIAVYASALAALCWIWLGPWISRYMSDWASSLSLNENFSALPHAVRTTLSRLEIWDAVGKRILQRPFQGWGLDGVEHRGLPAIKNIFFPGDYVHHPHNAAMQVWIDFGLAGPVALSIAIIFVTIKLALRPEHTLLWQSPLAYGMLLVAFIGHGLLETWWLALAGYVFAVGYILANRKRHLSNHPN